MPPPPLAKKIPDYAPVKACFSPGFPDDSLFSFKFRQAKNAFISILCQIFYTFCLEKWNAKTNNFSAGLQSSWTGSRRRQLKLLLCFGFTETALHLENTKLSPIFLLIQIQLMWLLAGSLVGLLVGKSYHTKQKDGYRYS